MESKTTGCPPTCTMGPASFVALAVVQLVAVSVVIVCGMMAGEALGMAGIAVVELAFLIFWPFRSSVADWVFGGVAAGISLLAAGAAVKSSGTPASGDLSSLMIAQGLSDVEVWSVVVAVLLVATVVVAFGRQMLRASRTHLVRSLSHGITSGVALIGAAGWLFLPDLMPLGTGNRRTFLLVVLVVALVAGVVLSCVWWSDADPDPETRFPWVGIALLPVLITGYVVYLLAVLLPML